ncbi:DUF4918 family protein [Cytophagaceae bacterium ABcell3]|nr:DUF4918 family protein [Cytophagaceae bacterium ABcell3]
MKSFADKLIAYNELLEYTGPLPANIRVMNPFQESVQALEISSAFYQKFYSDNQPRRLIIGINPGRFGGGVTGIPFTDTKRLQSECGIPYEGKDTYEPSSVFVYDVINAYGGAEAFYKKFLVHAVFPLAITKVGENGKETNFNYYDSRELKDAVYDFTVRHIKRLIAMGMNTEKCYCLGTNKNFKFLQKLNKEHHFFKDIIPLEHPRFIVQYKSRYKQEYIDKYLEVLGRPN